MSARSILISSFRIRPSLPLGLRPGRDLGADFGQGYLFAHPLDAVAATALIVADTHLGEASPESRVSEPPAARHIA